MFARSLCYTKWQKLFLKFREKDARIFSNLKKEMDRTMKWNNYKRHEKVHIDKIR